METYRIAEYLTPEQRLRAVRVGPRNAFEPIGVPPCRQALGQLGAAAVGVGAELGFQFGYQCIVHSLLHVDPFHCGAELAAVGGFRAE